MCTLCARSLASGELDWTGAEEAEVCGGVHRKWGVEAGPGDGVRHELPPAGPWVYRLRQLSPVPHSVGLPWGFRMVKHLPAVQETQGSVPGSGRCPGEGNGNPLQYSCLENYPDRGAWQATVHGIAKSQTGLSD